MSIENEADDATVTAFGYRQQLRRSLGFLSMFTISFSVISITTGIFVNFGFGITNFGPAAIWTWPIVVVGQLLLSLVLAELGSRVPIAGIGYQWGARLVGPSLGWIIAFEILAAFMLASGGETLLLISPLIASVLNLDASNTLLMTLISVGVFVLVALINIFSVRLTARINNVSLVTEVVGTVVLGLILLIVFLSHPNHGIDFLFSTSNPARNPAWYGFFLAMLIGIFTIEGMETASDLGEEGIGVRRAVPRAIIYSVLISGVLGMITLFCVALAIPNLEKTASDAAPIAYIASYWLGPIVSKIFVVCIIYSVFALIVVSVAAMARLVFSLSRDNMLPASGFLVRVNDRTRTPVNAIVVTSLLFIAVMLFAAARPNAYAILIASTPILAYSGYLLIVLAYAFRRDRIAHLPTGFDLGRWAVPVFALTVVWLVGALLVLTLPSAFHDGDKTAAGVFVVAIIWYFVWLRRRIKRGEAGRSLLHPSGMGAAPDASTGA
ncbi:MAG TPA: amino acid permease [Candidatus Dormibacteraeota bacterium]|nr:amino acid permease [Candidatus Dormibacteraeota bacterium]